VRCYLLEGKHASGASMDGRIIGLSISEAELELERSLRQLTDLRLVVVDAHGAEVGKPLYAKVLPRGAGAVDGVVGIRFTAVSPASAAWIRERLAAP
jgi:hypothetical protein